jgi:hypothetical protein
VVEVLVAERDDAVVARPALEDARGRAEAGTELTSVVPPTARPSGRTIGGVPIVASWPGVAVQAQGHVARARGEGAVVVARALLEHDDVQAAGGELAATAAPPAPVPTTTASADSSVTRAPGARRPRGRSPACA